jgi:hypothetical protein
MAYNALITHHSDQVPVDDKEFEPDYYPPEAVKTCYLNNNYGPNSDTRNIAFTNDKPYIQTPEIPGGIGEISFWYRAFSNSIGRLSIRSASSYTAPASNWVEIAYLDNITNTNYAYYVANFYILTNKFIRIYADMPTDRIALDNVLVSEPVGADFEIRQFKTIPQIPLYTDEVRFSAELTSFLLDPSNIEVRVYYRIGTNDWASWEPSNWVPLNLVSNTPVSQYYETPVGSGIPPQPVDTVVQYYLYVSFGGTFAEVSSPKLYKTFTNPSWYYPVDLNAGQSATNPYYFVFSCLPGSVWINEVNIWDDGPTRTNQYIELCGKAGANISNWWIEVLNTSFVPLQQYRITNNTVFLNETNGFGFWVIGSNIVPNIDQPLTNALPDYGGICLKRSMGAIEDAICYNAAYSMTNQYPFVYAGNDDDWEFWALAMTGTGSNRSDFSWINSATIFTPGIINPGQTLLGESPPATSHVQLTRFWLDSTNTWLVFTGINITSPSPWYSSNLLQTNWLPVSSFVTIIGADNVYTQYFPKMTNYPVYYYRIKAVPLP